MASAQCQIVNSTDSTIILKIIGSEPTANYTPDLPGVLTGLMFAVSPHNQDLQILYTGKRVVIVWNSDGSAILAVYKIDLRIPATIVIRKNAVTMQYSVDATDANGSIVIA